MEEGARVGRLDALLAVKMRVSLVLSVDFDFAPHENE